MSLVAERKAGYPVIGITTEIIVSVWSRIAFVLSVRQRIKGFIKAFKSDCAIDGLLASIQFRDSVLASGFSISRMGARQFMTFSGPIYSDHMFTTLITS